MIIGFPFKGNNKTGIIVNEDETHFIYLNKKREFKHINKKNLSWDMLNNDVYFEIPVYAKIISIEESIVLYRMKQRKEDFLYSFLQVVEFINDDNGISVVLQTERRDFARVRMAINEVEFNFYKVK